MPDTGDHWPGIAMQSYDMPLDKAASDLRCRVGHAILDLMSIQHDLLQLTTRIAEDQP